MKISAVIILALVIGYFPAHAQASTLSDQLLNVKRWHYRMTVTVNTPEGIVTGSAVREVTTHNEPKLFSEQGGGYATLSSGEAVVVDLGKRGVFYALIHNVKFKDSYGYDVIFKAFPFDGPLTLEGQDYYAALTGKVILPEDLYPTFVYFKNPKDLASLQRLRDVEARSFEDPVLLKHDYFEEAFGKGVVLREVSVEMTKEPVTHNPYIHVITQSQRYADWVKKLPYSDPLKLPQRYFGGH